MLNRDEQADRIVTAWAVRERARGFIFTDRTTAMDLAMIALTALECGETHPDRPDVRCTQPPHDQGHLYHRNSDLNVEWWTSGDGVASTAHDVLGPIQLVQAPVRADVEIDVPFIGAGETLQAKPDPSLPGVRCPECRWIGQDGRDHDYLIGGWTRCVHCGWEWRGQKTRPSSWCRAQHPEFDVYCDTVHHPLNTRQHGSSVYGIQWVAPDGADVSAEDEPRGRYHTLPPCEDDTTPEDPTHDVDHGPWGPGDAIPDSVDRVENAHHFVWTRVRNRDGEKTGWFELSECPVLTEADLLTLLGPITESDDATDDVDPDLAGMIAADRAVYRDLLPILESVATFLNDLGKRYREGNPRMTSATCRTAETHRDALHDTAGKLRDLLDGTDS